MKTYYIYNLLTDDFLGTVTADSIRAAELKAIQEIEPASLLNSIYIVAFTEKQ
jgi:hypothetical protein